MAFILKDRVREITTTTGTGTITLGGAVVGFQSFAVVGDGNQTYYTITDNIDWEVGIGTYTLSGTTLSRDTVLASSASGAKISWGAGSKDVFLTYPAEGAVTIDGTQTLTNKNFIKRVVVIADGTSVTMNADTTDIATQANTQAVGTLTINAPTGTPLNGQQLIFRLSSVNVQTFSWNAVFQGSNDVPLPTSSTGSSKYDYMGFIYNSVNSKWQAIAKNFGF